MDYKRGLGIGLIFMGLFLILTGNIITGAVIGTSPENYLSLIGVVIFITGIFLILVSGLEKRVEASFGQEHEEAHDYANYQRLKNRLSEMRAQKLRGTEPVKVPIGRYLSRHEEKKIYDIIWKNLPEEIKNSEDLEMSISGSLSIAREGKRKPGKYDIPEQLSSDQFYLSDVDVSIAGQKAFDYIESKWGSAVIRGGGRRGGGKLRNTATYKITNEEYLNKKERESGYMAEAPDWIKDMIRELSQHKFAGEKRPVNIKFFKERESLEESPRDILYYAEPKD